MAIATHLGIGISLHNYMHCNHARATRHAHVNSAQQHSYTLRLSLQVATSTHTTGRAAEVSAAPVKLY